MTSKFTAEQKYKIVMESFNSADAINVLCRRHGVSPVNFRKWREKFIEGGRRSLVKSGSRNEKVMLFRNLSGMMPFGYQLGVIKC